MGMEEFQYRAFISYSHKDKEAATWLHRALEGYRVPQRLVGLAGRHGVVGKRLGKVFRDREDLAVASDLSGKINEALRLSQTLIVICSPESAKSAWVNQEIINFKRLRGADAIIAVIVGGEPYASTRAAGADEECFPPALREVVDADGNLTGTPAEPIAADFRRGKDGRRHGSLKVIAGLLDVSLDELVRRETQRRQRRLILVAAASLAASLVLASLSVMALLARNEAQAQRLIAERARDDTKQKKQQAEGLIEFMLGDLRKKLQPVGRLDVLDAVGEQAMSYFGSLREDELDTDSLGRRARALQLIGEIDDLKGDFPAATRAFDQAELSTARLMANEPGNAQRIFEHAQSVYWKGYERFRQGQFVAAGEQFQAYHDLAVKLTELDAANTKWRVELGSSEVNLGIASLRAGQVATAIGQFNDAYKTYSDLSQSDPVYRFDVAHMLAWLSDARYFLGEMLEAERVEKEEVAIYDTLQQEDPRNESVANARLLALGRMGLYSLHLNRLEEATGYFDTMVGIAERLTQKDQANAKWSRYLAQAMLHRAEVLRERHRAQDAARELESVRPVLGKLALHDEPYATWKVYLAGQELLLGAGIALDAGRVDDAGAALAPLNDLLKTAFAKSPTDPDTWRVGMEGALLEGDILNRKGLSAPAKAAWSRAAELAHDGARYAGASSDMVTVESDLRLGRPEQARSAAKKLCDNGVRRGSLMSLCTAH